jgi:hypothetical protein
MGTMPSEARCGYPAGKEMAARRGTLGGRKKTYWVKTNVSSIAKRYQLTSLFRADWADCCLDDTIPLG